ncbi:MAG: PepSY-like domain-containing protein [Emticicia sp.]|uniref:PepSY-like domain-containing protein n=1 Tax=Emticicia sp. TaxID=1930953 RepID=UPI003BA45E12
MKKLYIYLFFVGLILWSCDRITDLQPKQNFDEVVPVAAINAIKVNYPEATKVRFTTIEKSKIFQSDFDVKIDRMSAIVNNVGVISERYRQTDFAALPDKIKTYLNTNYSGVAFINACQQINKEGKIEGYKVMLKDSKHITLIFDTTGTLIMNVSDNPNGGNPSGMPPPKLYFIDKNDLPQVIVDFLAAKHGDYKCIKVGVVVESNSKNYSVVISQNFTTFDYLFDEKGNVLKSSSFGVNAPSGRFEDKPITINDLTTKIKSYLDKEYKGWQFERGIAFIQNGAIQVYNVLITYDKKQYSLQFDKDSNFLKKEQVGVGGNDNRVEIKLIFPKDVPATIVNYLVSKHKDYKYIQTAIIIDKTKKTYWITILSDNEVYDYTFDESGKFLSVKEIEMKFPENKIYDRPLEPKDIPIKVKEYLDVNYKGWTFQRGVMVYAENKLLGYVLAIKVGNDYYYINFDASANFVSARKG